MAEYKPLQIRIYGLLQSFTFLFLFQKTIAQFGQRWQGGIIIFFCQCSSKANKASYNICNIDKYCYIVNIFWLISVCLIFASFAVLSENQTWCVINYRQFESETNTLRGGLKNQYLLLFGVMSSFKLDQRRIKKINSDYTAPKK